MYSNTVGIIFAVHLSHKGIITKPVCLDIGIEPFTVIHPKRLFFLCVYFIHQENGVSLLMDLLMDKRECVLQKHI